jgi:hypothetical protein
MWRPLGVGSAILGLIGAVQAQVGGGVGGYLENALPVDQIVLTYSAADRQFTTTRVPPNGRVPLTGTILSQEVIAVQVSRRTSSVICGEGNKTQDARASDLEVLKKELDKEILEAPTSREVIELKSEIARLTVEQASDERQTYWNDPLRKELERQADRDFVNGPMGPDIEAEDFKNDKEFFDEIGNRIDRREFIERERQRERAREAVANLGSDITTRSLAWADVEQARLQLLYDELHTLAPLVEQAKLAVKIQEQELADKERTVSAWHAYSAAVVTALDAAMPPSDTAANQPIEPVSIAKACAGPSGLSDVVLLEGPDRSGVSVLIAEVSFDRGNKQLTWLRRLATSRRWAGRLDWPVEATTATVRVRWPGSGRWYSMKGPISVQRKSDRARVDDARSAAKVIAARMKDSNFRTKGGDTVKTMVVF